MVCLRGEIEHVDMVRSIDESNYLPKSFGILALRLADSIINGFHLRRNTKRKTMGILFYKPSRELKVFGCSLNAEFFGPKALGSKNKTRRPTYRLCLYIDAEEHELGDLGEPANYKAALLDPESKKWLDAMNVEMKSMKDNDVWVLVELPPNSKIFGSKWLFKKKTDMDGAVHHSYAAYYEEYGNWDVTKPLSSLTSIRRRYMEQPEGFVNSKRSNHVCKLKRSIYGLKQASRQWNKRFDDEIKKFDYREFESKAVNWFKSKCLHWENLEIILHAENSKIFPTLRLWFYYVCCEMYSPDVAVCKNNDKSISQDPGNMKRQLRVSCYTDAGYLTDADNLKSQTGYVFVLNGGAD
ncbi:retrotransposon protein, putative, ty1-copia subclass [Tanacetum coccineum]